MKLLLFTRLLLQLLLVSGLFANLSKYNFIEIRLNTWNNIKLQRSEKQAPKKADWLLLVVVGWWLSWLLLVAKNFSIGWSLVDDQRVCNQSFWLDDFLVRTRIASHFSYTAANCFEVRRFYSSFFQVSALQAYEWWMSNAGMLLKHSCERGGVTYDR